MSIKGTLETFNLCELLQMLAFNQKEGTLVLEGESGARTIFLDQGRLTFLEQDPGISASVARMARYYQLADEKALSAAATRQEESGRNLGAVLETMGLIDKDRAQELHRGAVVEQLFECQSTAVAGFEFVEGKALHADGSEGRPIQPLLPVESLLLDLARMLDHWNTVIGVVPGISEIYEGTGIAVDLTEHEAIDPELAATVTPLIDGRRSLEAIAETTHATHYAVMQIAATLFEGGGIRAVPTDDLVHRAEDMLSRGDAAATVAIFQRCIDRGDATIQVRLRLADALEASDNPAAAAAELDTYAALSDDDDAPAVFEALTRALRLRGGDLATAARACDYYLRRRPWLQDYRSEAAYALRDLITAATTSGRPADAAVRLQGFIESGDAPPEDGVLLADLYAAGGARREAADALYRRAEDLIATDRTAPARQLLRRALELDPGHADARRRKAELEGVRKRRGHRARIALILLALGGVASAAGVAWFGYQDTASTELVDGRAVATDAIDRAETRGRAAVDAFRAYIDTIEKDGLIDEEVATRAAAMRAEVTAILAAAVGPIRDYAAAIDSGQAAGQVTQHKEELARFEQRSALLQDQAKQAVQQLAAQARTALGEAQEHHSAGHFEAAARRLRTAWTLSFDDANTHTDVTRRLDNVREYIERFKALQARMEALTAAGDLQGAFQAGLESVTGEDALYDSDLTRQLAFPVRVTSEPKGAEVWLSGEDTGLRTPCLLTYSPFAVDSNKKDAVIQYPVVRLRMPGRVPSITRLPEFNQMRRDPASLASYEPAISATLPAGPRWTIGDPTDHFYALWASSTMPLVAGNRGHLVYAAEPSDGQLMPGARMPPERDGIRMAGRIGDIAWHVTGHRTLTVRPKTSVPWDFITIGRIERAPIVVSGRLILVDEVGNVYARKLGDGTRDWRCELGGLPTQPPFPSPLGLLVARTDGASYRIDPENGDYEPLAPTAAGAILALPFGEEVLLLGGGARGCRVVGVDGTIRVLGDAQPNITRAAWVEPAGVAWIEATGSVRWLATGAKAPVSVSGLGEDVDRIGGGGGSLFGASVDGRMRAVSLSEPKQASWTAPLGGRAQRRPIRIGGGLYVLVNGRLVAFDV